METSKSVVRLRSTNSVSGLSKLSNLGIKNSSPLTQARTSENEAPIFRRSSRFPLRVFDKVIIDATWDDVKRLSENHGGWNEMMFPYCQKLGYIHRFTEPGDARVKFGLDDDAPRFTYNIEVLRPIYLVGDTIQTISSMSRITKYQSSRQELTKPEVDISSKTTQVLAVSSTNCCVLVTIDDKFYWLSYDSIILRVSNNETFRMLIGDKYSIFNDPSVKLDAWTPTGCHLCQNDVWKMKYQEMMEFHTCSICLEEMRNVVFDCGHGSCKKCSSSLDHCHLCRKTITRRIDIF